MNSICRGHISVDNRPLITHGIVFFLFCVVAIAYTYPLVDNLGTSVSGDLGDPLQFVWVMSWNLHAFLNSPFSLYQTNTYYPLPNSLIYGEPAFGASLLALPVRAFTDNALVIYNFSFLATYVFCGFFAYLFVRRITGGHLGAILAGLSFAYCTYRTFHIGHINLLGNFSLPLLLLFTFQYLTSGQKWKDLLCACASYLLLSLYSAYYLVFTIPFILAFLLYFLIANRKTLQWKRLGFQSAVAALLTIGILLVFYHPHLKNNTQGEILFRDLNAQVNYSAEPKDYLALCKQNPRLSKFAFRVERQGETALFPGLIPAIGLILLLPLHQYWRKAGHASILAALICAMGVAFIFSQGPLLDEDNPESFKLPYYYLYQYFPGASRLRVSARFGMYAGAAMAFLGGIGIHHALTSIKRKFLRWSLFVSLLALFSYEATVLPFPVLTVPGAENPPKTYKRIADFPKGTPIVELPILDGTCSEGIYLYYSTLHWQPLVNGVTSFTPANYDTIRAILRSFPSDRSIAWLQENGVQYAHIHLSLWHKNHHPPLKALEEKWLEELSLCEESDDTVLLRIRDRRVLIPEQWSIMGPYELSSHEQGSICRTVGPPQSPEILTIPTKDDGYIDLTAVFGNHSWKGAIAECNINVPSDCKAYMVTEADNSMYIEVNGKPVPSLPLSTGGLEFMEHVVSVPLDAGENRIKCEIGSDFGGWGFRTKFLIPKNRDSSLRSE